MSSSRKPSTWVLTLRLRCRRSWTSWRLSRTSRRLAREDRRAALLQQSLDSSLLRIKELEQLERMQEHRLQEMAESEQFRQTGSLPPVSSTTDLDELLGLSTPPR